ncbi:MAG TPA: hypothetical protein VGN16_15200 [Acidobacteriaceae bacterium]|jgi:hypothetical protein
MHIDWSAAWNYVYGNRVALGAVAVTVCTAAVATAPVPESRTGKWVYDFFHQVFNIKNTRLSEAPIPTPPAPQESAAPSKAS